MSSLRNLPDTLRFIRSGLIYAVLAGAVSSVAAYLITARTPSMFDATASLYSAPLPQGEAWLAGIRFAPARLDGEAYALAAVSGPVLARAIDILGEGEATPSRSLLRQATSVRVDETSSSSFVHLTVRLPSPDLAARSANAIAASLIEWDRERIARSLETYVSAMETQLAALAEGASTLSLESDAVSQRQLDVNLDSQAELRTSLTMLGSFPRLGFSTLHTFEPAGVPAEPAAPQPVLAAVLAFAVGAVGTFGLLAAFQASRLDRRSHERSQPG